MKRIVNLPGLINFLKNEPLVISESSIAHVNPNIFSTGGSIFFGVGVMTESQISQSVPFDILAMFFISELLRQKLDFKKVIVLIADSHAMSNKRFSDAKINKIAARTKNVLQKIIRNFNLNCFQLVCGSEIHAKPELKNIMQNLPDFPNAYLKHEIADLIWFHKTENVLIKLGWALTAHECATGHDERFFDRKIARSLPDLSLIHLEAGRTFNRERLRVSPYLSLAGEKRILLLKHENVCLKLETAKTELPRDVFRGTTNHLLQIIRLFEKLNGNLLNMNFEEKLEFIICIATK